MKHLQNQVMWNRLISIVEEQALALVRTAFSTSVREAGDLSAGVYDTKGRMIAQAITGTPGHVNTMAAAVVNFIEDIGPHRIYDGDVYITNDPWKGTGHLHDFTVVTPVFRNGKLIGYFGCTAHVVDVGGRGFSPDATEVYEEGLFVPIMKFLERGEINDDLINIVRHNVRESSQVIGDLHSLSTSNETGVRRLHAMLDEFNLENLDDLAEFIFEKTEEATKKRLAKLPPGEYTNEMQVDGYNKTVNLKVAINVNENGAHADFAGSSPTCENGVNVPLVYAHAYYSYAMLVALAPEMPSNYASLAAFTVSAPEGCILNAKHPDPVAVRHVTGHFVTDLCLGAIAEALPEIIPAEGAGALWNFHVSARPSNPGSGLPNREILMFNSGGTGARPELDGLNSTAFPSGVRTMSSEATEQVGPIVIWRKELRPDSGGKGRQRGGLGQIIELAPSDGYKFFFSCMFDRVENPARGRNGGGNGLPGKVYLDDGTPFDAKGKQAVPEGKRLILELPGGGGFGDPEERDSSLLKNDIEQGYVS